MDMDYFDYDNDDVLPKRVCLRRCAGDVNPNTTTTESENAAFVRLLQLSDQNQLSLAQYNEKNGVSPRGYEHFNPAMLESNPPIARQGGYFWFYDVRDARGTNPDTNIVSQLCYILATTYVRGKRDMLRYYKMRDLYVGTMDYEIGYATHAIISKYMDTLELLNIVRFRFLGGGIDKNHIPNNVMWFLYTNILENCRSIIALCNMMHEIQGKYNKSIGDTAWDQMELSSKKKKKRKKKRITTRITPAHAGNQTTATTVKGETTSPPPSVENKEEELGEGDDGGALTHREYMEKMERERRRKEKAKMKEKRALDKFLVTYKSTTRTKRPVRYWVNNGGFHDYGWSIEEGTW